MWIVKNVLRGALYIDDLDVKIPPKDYFDLDKIGRDRVKKSKVIKLAFEEGYLQNVKKDDDPGHLTEAKPGHDGQEEIAAIEDRLRELQEMIARGFSLSQIEARLATLQEEMADCGSYSDRLQSLIREFRNTLLARPLATYPAPATTDALPVSPSSVRQNVQQQVQTIHQIISQVQNSILQSQQTHTSGNPAEALRQAPGAKSTPPHSQPHQSLQELEKLTQQLKELQQNLNATEQEEAVPLPAPPVKNNEQPEQLLDFRKALVNDFMQAARQIMKTNGGQPGENLNVDEMSESEIRARMQVLSEREHEIKANFNHIGKISQGSTDAQDMADLLCDI